MAARTTVFIIQGLPNPGWGRAQAVLAGHGVRELEGRGSCGWLSALPVQPSGSALPSITALEAARLVTLCLGVSADSGATPIAWLAAVLTGAGAAGSGATRFLLPRSADPGRTSWLL